MMYFHEFLLQSEYFQLFEESPFCKMIINKLSPEEQEEFIKYIKDADPVNIMRMIRQVQGEHHAKGHKHLVYPSGVKL